MRSGGQLERRTRTGQTNHPAFTNVLVFVSKVFVVDVVDVCIDLLQIDVTLKETRAAIERLSDHDLQRR